MTFILTTEQAMVRDSARQLATAVSVRAARSLLGGEPIVAYDAGLLRQSSELGLGAILVPEKFGGVSLDIVTASLVARELGRKLVASPLLGATVAASALAGSAPQPLAESWLSRIARGECVVGVALDGHEAPTVRLSDHGRLDGQAEWAIDAATADALLVAVATSHGTTLVLVPTENTGLSRTSQRMAEDRKSVV